MLNTKVFKSGNSTAIRFPTQFGLKPGVQVEISKQGDTILIREHKQNLAEAIKALSKCSDDFFAEGRIDLPPQQRNF